MMTCIIYASRADLMAQKLTMRGIPEGLSARTLGRVTFQPIDPADRPNFFLAVTRNTEANADVTGYAGVLVESGAEQFIPETGTTPIIKNYDDVSSISEDS